MNSCLNSKLDNVFLRLILIGFSFGWVGLFTNVLGKLIILMRSSIALSSLDKLGISFVWINNLNCGLKAKSFW